MLYISFPEIKNALEKFVLPESNFVIGIAEGGVVLASLCAYKLGCELKVIKINLRDDENNPRYDAPKVIYNLQENYNNKKILLVDDVSVSGKTLETAKKLFPNNDIKTFVLKGKADFVLFPDIKECIDLPWRMKKQS